MKKLRARHPLIGPPRKPDGFSLITCCELLHYTTQIIALTPRIDEILGLFKKLSLS